MCSCVHLPCICCLDQVLNLHSIDSFMFLRDGVDHVHDLIHVCTIHIFQFIWLCGNKCTLENKQASIVLTCRHSNKSYNLTFMVLPLRILPICLWRTKKLSNSLKFWRSILRLIASSMYCGSLQFVIGSNVIVMVQQSPGHASIRVIFRDSNHVVIGCFAFHIGILLQ